MPASLEETFQKLYDGFEALRTRAETQGLPFVAVHPRRFEAIEKVDDLRTSGPEPLLAVVRVAFRTAPGDDRCAFYRVEVHFLTGVIGFSSFDAERRMMQSERGHVSYHGLYEARGEEPHAISTGAQIVQVAAAALHLDRAGRQDDYRRIKRMLQAAQGEMPGYPEPPQFDIMSEFSL